MTYFVAIPFEWNEDGELAAGDAQERQSAGAAEASAGAVAFSRTGDPATGEFEDTAVLREFGEVPSLEELLEPG